MHQRLHLLAVLFVALLGLGFVFAPRTTLPLLAEAGLLDAAPAMSASATRYVHFVYGVLGAVMVGWAALLGFMLAPRLDPRRAAAMSLLLWFLLDTGLSLGTGHPRNAALNLLCVVSVLLPLALMPAKERPGASEGPTQG